MRREEGGLGDLNTTVENKAKCTEHVFKGGGWITTLPRSQDGTGISRE